jgi:IS5 family transposase
MYRKKPFGQLEFEDFYLPFGGKLRSDNRWVKLSKLIPWEKIEKKYSKQFSKKMGAPAKSLRMSLGALIIKERCGFTDEETVEQIKENPYLQYFIGLSEYTEDAPFDPSMMVHFRKRINLEILDEINEMIIKPEKSNKNVNDDEDENNSSGRNHGQLIFDASCTPADIRYPTDLSLLNEGREKLETVIDILHEPLKGKKKKPRTYRENARKNYLRTAKKRKKKAGEIKKTIGKQLRFICRDLKHIEALLEKSSLELLSNYQYKCLLVIKELYRQQKEMYDKGSRSVDNRIVSISQPHVRPIVRGKASAQVEFGAKISLSVVNGYSRIEDLRWNNYNESVDFKEHVVRYKKRYGCYPESICVDQIYRTRNNIKYCKENNIRISGPKLGRPPKELDKSIDIKLEKQDLRDRVAVEGKFGEGKRKYGLSRIMAKLSETSESVIGTTILIMNLEKKLRLLLGNFIFQINLQFSLANYKI